MGFQYIWEIAEPSPFLIGTKTFGTERPIYLLDQYNGRQPYLFNSEFLTTRNLQLEMGASVLLDSNLMDAVVKRINGDMSDKALEDLLQFAVGHGWDFNARFYLMEQRAKSNEGDFEQHATRH